MNRERLSHIGAPNPPVKTRQQILDAAADLMVNEGYVAGTKGLNTSMKGPHCIVGAVGAVGGAIDMYEAERIAETILGVDYATAWKASDRMEYQYPLRRYIQRRYTPAHRAARILRDVASGMNFMVAVKRERVYEKPEF
jgi:hypothetical protein